MEHEPGDAYIRRIATFIRTYEQRLAEGGISRRKRPKRPPESASSVLNPLSWLGLDGNAAAQPAVKPLVLTLDTHRLFYILIRLEAIGIDIGSLDVKVDCPSRPMNYIDVFSGVDKSETLSLSSIRSSLSAVSRLSLGSSLWGKPAPPSLDTELKFIYSAFTKLPALTLVAPGPKSIAELAEEPPNENALPLDAFKNLQSLECIDIDPRTLLGWDRLAESLWSLTIKRSGLEDVSDVFIGAVADDQARREGRVSSSRRRKLGLSRQASFFSTNLPESVPEDEDEEDPATPTLPTTPTGDSSPATKLPSHKWAFLKHLSLADNALTFLPTAPLPFLTSLTHLELSSNLLVSVPPGLSALYNLVSLNMADNMIDSVLGIYTMLGQILYLNLSHNRLESLCGLERLLALERVDLRNNLIDESAEVGRLATLPNVKEVWVEGNPFMEIEENHRVRCFEYFWKEGKDITLDGSPPGFYEKRFMTSPPPEQMTSSRPVSVAYSPPVVPVGSAVNANGRTPSSTSPALSPATSQPSSHNASPHIGATSSALVSKGKRKKNKRIVDLDKNGEGEHVHGHGEERKHGHGRTMSEGKVLRRKERKDHSPVKPIQTVDITDRDSEVDITDRDSEVSTEPNRMENGTKPPTATDPAPSVPPSLDTTPTRLNPRSRHTRRQTSYVAASTTIHAMPSIPSASPSPTILSPSPSTPSPTSPNPDLNPLSNPSPTRALPRRSATLSAKSKLRRARVSASVYEAPGSNGADEDGGHKEAEAFRARIEALRSDMGEGWLKVFSQTQLESPQRA